jgi:hypothetical protein
VIEDAHRLVRRGGPGQREITQQINQAYALLLSSQFQGFCRDLHSECARLLLVPGSSPAIQAVHFTNIMHGRRLDSGNPTPGNIGADLASAWRSGRRLTPIIHGTLSGRPCWRTESLAERAIA